MGPGRRWWATLADAGMNLPRRETWSEAVPALRECLAICAKAVADSRTRFYAMSLHSGSLLGRSRDIEAGRVIVKGNEGL